ncbi:MAG: glycosyltransferase family 4 protein, partial [Planctomycetota bacterium]
SPYCIENERISAISPKDDGSVTRARERFGVRSGCCCFLFCGKLIDKKQPLGLLEALKQAVRAGADAHLLIVGEGELRHECDAFCRAHDLPVTFTGFLNQSEIGMAYSASDALVLPSNDGETWGLVVNEAFAAGLPALVSDKVGCHPDLIDKSATGWVHRFGDWQQLSRQMIAAAEDVERLAEYGDNAKRRIQNYSPLHAAEGLLKAAAFVNQNSAR